MEERKGLDRRADLGDVFNFYLLLLGRSPESRPVVREKVGARFDALVESMLDCGEFRENVLGATAGEGRLPHDLLPGSPSPGMRRWAASRLADPGASDARIRRASSWKALLGAVLSQPGLFGILQKVAGDRAEEFTRALSNAAGAQAPASPLEKAPGFAALALHRIGLTRSAVLEQRMRVARSGLFDPDFYCAEYPDVAERREDPLTHFMAWGVFEGRRPNALFDTHWYLGCHSHLRASRSNPLVHYLAAAGDELSNPNPLFDKTWYLGRYPDVGNSEVDALAHFLRHGAAEGRSPHPAFDLPYYLSTFERGIPGGVNPLEYYLEHPREPGHEPNPMFETSWYLGQHQSDLSAGDNPLVHYLAQDPTAMVDPSPRFSTMGYLHTYPTVRASGANALVHYLETGRSEGREPLLAQQCGLPLRVAIIAEVSLPQCLKYRVLQKQKMIRSLGHDCSVISRRDFSACVEAMRTHNLFIFYRVPAYPEMLEIIEIARRAGLPVLWEVDDIIFSGEDYMTNRNLGDLDLDLQRSVLSGVPLFRKALLACGVGLASTPGVADAMRRVGVDSVFVVENALDDETIRLAADLTPRPSSHVSKPIVIIYGSGGKTHDTDFRLAAPSLLAVLKTHPLVRVRIVGELNLPLGFDELGEQIERVPLLPFPDYMQLLSQSDLAICPVEDTVFSDAKSNIKFLEASILGVPSICSPRSAFKVALREGENGLFAEGGEQWFQALTTLVEDADLRRRLGGQARRDVLSELRPPGRRRASAGPDPAGLLEAKSAAPGAVGKHLL